MRLIPLPERLCDTLPGPDDVTTFGGVFAPMDNSKENTQMSWRLLEIDSVPYGDREMLTGEMVLCVRGLLERYSLATVYLGTIARGVLRTYFVLKMVKPDQVGLVNAETMGTYAVDRMAIRSAIVSPKVRKSGDSSLRIHYYAIVLDREFLGGGANRKALLSVCPSISTHLAFETDRPRTLQLMIDRDKLRAVIALAHVVLGRSIHRARGADGERTAYRGPRLEITERQFGIIEMVGRGKTDKEIAKDLGVSYHTVHNTVNRLMRKFSVTRRVRLAAAVRGAAGIGESADAS